MVILQGILLAELDLLAWQLRLRDGAEAAMPRSLRRQLMKSSRKAIVKAQQPGQLPSGADCGEDFVSSDSESKDLTGEHPCIQKWITLCSLLRGLDLSSLRKVSPRQAGIDSFLVQFWHD